jgi:hypothetical protein
VIDVDDSSPHDGSWLRLSDAMSAAIFGRTSVRFVVRPEVDFDQLSWPKCLQDSGRLDESKNNEKVSQVGHA